MTDGDYHKWLRMRERLTGNSGINGSRLWKHRHLIYAASFGPVPQGSEGNP
jgi:hypothetical protein